MTSVKTINEKSFEEEVLNEQGKVLIDFYTETCPPCQMMSPVLDQVAKDLPSSIKILKVDATESQELVEKYKVNSVPTFILFEGGNVKKSRTGVIPPVQLKSWMEV